MHTSNALVVEGGAMRGIFTTGLLDEFLEHHFNPFNFYCGVSAGALNLSAYLAGVKERNLKLYTEFATKPEFMSVKRFLAGGHFIDMDWLWHTMNQHFRIDLEKVSQHKFHVGVTDVSRAKTLFQQAKADTLDQLLKISSTLPVLYRGLPQFNGSLMSDGGLMDAIPVRHAIDQGAKNIMVVRSRLKEYRQETHFSDRFLAFIFRRYPVLAEQLKNRSERYNQTLDLIRNPPPGVNILEVCPPAGFNVSRLDRSKANLYKNYESGRQIAYDVMDRWSKMLEPVSKPSKLIL